MRIVIAEPSSLQFLNFWVALGAGYFTAEGLNVRVVAPPSPPAAAQPLLEGQAEMAVLGPPQYLGLIGLQQPVVLVASLLVNEPVNLVVRKEVAEARRLSPALSLAERLRGIRGLRIGLAPQIPPRLRALLAPAGLDADRDVQMVILLGEEQDRAFAERRVDALFTHTPHLEKALVEQDGLLLAHISGGEVPALAGLQIHSLVTTRRFAAAEPEIVMAVTRALYRAQQLVHADQRAASEAVLRSGLQGLDRRLVERIVAIYEPAVPRTPEVSLTGVHRVLALYPVFGPRPDFTRINLADYVAPQFAQQAVAEPR